MANVCFPADAAAGDFICDNYFRYAKVGVNKSGCFVKSGIACVFKHPANSRFAPSVEKLPLP